MEDVASIMPEKIVMGFAPLVAGIEGPDRQGTDFGRGAVSPRGRRVSRLECAGERGHERE